ncbi:MAG: histidinol-phosphate transaminase [Acidobacteriaceae bacterium]|nr:histidinol-phosphate transaminase [Acidobacteriaceae bacterium]
MIETKTVKPRKLVETMPEYHPPLAGRDALRLDFNENTLAPSPRVMERLRQITGEGLTKYPEREPVERVVAAHFGLKPDQVLLTNAVDEAIHLMCCTFLEDGDEAIICTPTFFMYDVNISMFTRGLVKVQAGASLEFPFERYMAAITNKTKLMIVASPNNPTGATISREQLLAIAKAAPQAVLLVDEAYYHFHGETVIGDLAQAPNIVVARTFSKAYGLANLRIGMLAGSAEIMKHLRKVSSPYNVNGVALDCLQAAIEDDAYLAWYVDQIHAGRRRIMDGLDKLGIGCFPSEANFVLMKIGPKHKDFVTAMRTHGVLVRDRSSDPGCDGYVRITVGVEQHVTKGLEAVEASLKEIGWKR